MEFLGATEETCAVLKSCFVIISIVKSCLCTVAQDWVSTLDVIFDEICASFNVGLLALLPQRSQHGLPFERDSFEEYLQQVEEFLLMARVLGLCMLSLEMGSPLLWSCRCNMLLKLIFAYYVSKP